MNPLKALPNSPSSIRPWPLRLLLVAPSAIALALVWNAVVRLDRTQSGRAELEQQNRRLGSDVENLEQKWKAVDLNAIKARHAGVKAQLRGGNELVALWLQQAHDYAVPLALDITPHFDTPLVRTIGAESVTLVPATLEIRPLAGGGDGRSLYQRLLVFCLDLSTQTNRADLVGIDVTTDTNSVAKATVSFCVWTQEFAP